MEYFTMLKKISQRIVAIVLVIVCVFLGALALFRTIKSPSESQQEQFLTVHHASIPDLWSRNNIDIQRSGSSRLIAAENKVFFIGSESAEKPSRVIALNSISGMTEWEYGKANEISLTSFGKTLFVGEVGSVTALDLDNGRILWSTSLPFAKSITKIVVQDSIVFADSVGMYYFLLDANTGDIIQTLMYVTNDDWNTNLPIWSDHLMNLEVGGAMMYYQSQTGIFPNGDAAEIVAIDISKNKVWSSNLNPISRISVNPFGVYVLNVDGRILRLNSTNGILDELIRFVPIPHLRNETRKGFVEHGYYVAVDTNEQVLCVYFGDSGQLFAFQLPVLP
jgi:hypothetical protein